ncbi:hypothetical protein SAMN05421839_1159 [Halolactibacillus halophilus]|uniref:Uncharacterized protein n=1 Tax=Halolactibacillus halophilus TaxID=306540 RepID=A0A1I5PJU7_9BACI|nr:hypothetical protein SAMN05421839_1159 [Halolactibacillus halophilus]
MESEVLQNVIGFYCKGVRDLSGSYNGNIKGNWMVFH